MPQDWTEWPDIFVLSHEAETDLGNFEKNFRCLRTLFSGASFGLNTFAGHPWYDTSTPIEGSGLLKIRKQGNDGWLGVLALAQESNNGLVWFHGDDLSNQEGWVIDIQITEDRVLALKNHGTPSATNVYTEGRAVDGSWDITGITADPHLHPAGTLRGPIHAHGLNTVQTDVYSQWPNFGNVTSCQTTGSGGYCTGSTGNSVASETTSDESWRIKAQVGIVIYPDI